jgi:selenocysteine lyase/cysteine desulfurase
MQVGTNNRAIFMGLMAGLRFLQTLGAPRVYARIHELARYACEQAAARPALELYSGADDVLYGSLISMGFRGKDPAPLWAKLRERRVWIYENPRLRLSCHVHTRREDLDLFFEAVDEVFPRKA